MGYLEFSRKEYHRGRHLRGGRNSRDDYLCNEDLRGEDIQLDRGKAGHGSKYQRSISSRPRKKKYIHRTFPALLERILLNQNSIAQRLQEVESVITAIVTRAALTLIQIQPQPQPRRFEHSKAPHRSHQSQAFLGSRLKVILIKHETEMTIPNSFSARRRDDFRCENGTIDPPALLPTTELNGTNEQNEPS